MKQHGNLFVTGKVGGLDIDTREAVRLLYGNLAAALETDAIVTVELRRGDGEAATGVVTFAEVVEAQPGLLAISLDVEVPDDLAAPPAPHVAAVDRLEEIVGPHPFGQAEG